MKCERKSELAYRNEAGAFRPSCTRRRRMAAAVMAMAAVLPLALNSFAAPITTPTGLLPGAQYRLAFVTAGTRDAASTDIADYDAFVTTEATSVPELSSLNTTWQVIGSTATVDARDHTGTDPIVPGIPIYLLNDTKLVDDYADLWDWTIDMPLEFDQNGVDISPVLSPIFAYSGTSPDGTAGGEGDPLGGANPTIGGPWLSNLGWISFAPEPNDSSFQRHLYSLSAVLTVPVPEAGICAMLTLSLAVLLLLRRFRTS